MVFRKIIVIGFVVISLISIKISEVIAGTLVSQDNINGIISISFSYDKIFNKTINFKKSGINGIMSLYSVSLYHKNQSCINDNPNNSFKKLFKANTDLISPYIVKADNVRDNKDLFFTGGWHGTPDKKPTSKTIDYSLYADNKKILNNKPIICNSVNIRVTNLIEGYNTIFLKKKNKYVLKEVINYTINKAKIDIHAEIEALQDTTILKYYGLETQNPGTEGRIIYIKSTGTHKEYCSSIYSTSGKRKEFPDINKLILYTKNPKNRITAWIDKNYGIGNMEFVDQKLPCAFTLKYGKSYFNLINGKGIKLVKGNKIFWKGGYIF